VRRSVIIWVLVAVLCVSSAVPASAAEAPVLDRIIENGEIRVGMSADQPPFNVRDRWGNLMGLDVDVAMLLAAAFETDLNIVQKPFPELLAALAAGEVDMVISGMSITAERATSVTFVGPYVMSGKSILTTSRLLAGAQEAEDINEDNIRLVALENSTSQRFVEKRIPLARLTTTDNYDSAVKMVLEDQADAMVADMPICQLALLQHPGEDLITLAQPLNIEPIGIAIAPGDPQLKSLLENYLDAMNGMGLIELLQAKWFEDGSWVPELP